MTQVTSGMCVISFDLMNTAWWRLSHSTGYVWKFISTLNQPTTHSWIILKNSIKENHENIPAEVFLMTYLTYLTNEQKYVKLEFDPININRVFSEWFSLNSVNAMNLDNVRN